MIIIDSYDEARRLEALRRSEHLFDILPVRVALRKFYHRTTGDKLAASIREQPRCNWHSDGDGYTEYAIWDGNMDDVEVEERIRDELYIPMVNSIYDCTGRFFTLWYDWKRCKAGIVVKHCVCLDV